MKKIDQFLGVLQKIVIITGIIITVIYGVKYSQNGRYNAALSSNAVVLIDTRTGDVYTIENGVTKKIMTLSK